MTRSGFAICSAFAMLLVASAAQSDLIVVTRYDDPPPDGCLPDDCSLREAVIAANSTSADDVIRLSAGTYELTIPDVDGNEDEAATGDLDLLEPVGLLGRGASMTTIDANGLATIVDRVSGSLIEGITFRGGGDADLASAMILIGPTRVEGCEIRDNGVPGDNVPAVRVVGANFTVTIVDTTIVGNHGNGGGLVALNSSVVLENVTVSGNSKRQLNVDNSVATCRHCTIVGGTAAEAETVLVRNGGLLEVANSVVVGDCSVNGGSSVIDSLGGNLESPGATCGLDQSDDEDGVLPAQLLLGPLAENGGTTRTHLPGAFSHAVDTGREDECAPFDQRGIARPAAECDRGAVERSTERPFTPLFIDGFEQGSAGAWSASVG